jgi:carbon monoxide dehydrogenase subunit G
MKLEGTAEFPFTATDVWAALHDTDILAKTIPGCKSMTPNDDGGFLVAVSLGVAAIKGDYEGTVNVTDVEFPNHYVLDGEGAGQPGYVSVRVDCHLSAKESGTQLNWSCDAEVGGLIAGIGGRVITGISKFMAKQFFKAFEQEMKIQFVELNSESEDG